MFLFIVRWRCLGRTAKLSFNTFIASLLPLWVKLSDVPPINLAWSCPSLWPLGLFVCACSHMPDQLPVDSFSSFSAVTQREREETCVTFLWLLRNGSCSCGCRSGGRLAILPTFPSRSGKFLWGNAAPVIIIPKQGPHAAYWFSLRRAENAGHLYNPRFFPQFSMNLECGPVLLGPPPFTLVLLHVIPLWGPLHIWGLPNLPVPHWDDLRTWVWPDSVMSDKNSPRFCPEQQRGSGVPGPDLLLFTPRKLIFHRRPCVVHGFFFFFFFGLLSSQGLAEGDPRPPNKHIAH